VVESPVVVVRAVVEDRPKTGVTFPSMEIEPFEEPAVAMCEVTEYSGETGETYRCKLPKGHRQPHKRGEAII
jgi:hypothetical protein